MLMDYHRQFYVKVWAGDYFEIILVFQRQQDAIYSFVKHT